MANCWWAFVFAVLCVSGAAQQKNQAKPSRVVSASLVDGIKIDGKLDEWQDRHRLAVLQRRGQVWDEVRRRTWRGVGDLSAEFYIGYDRSHLYLAGKVRDDHYLPPPEGAFPESGDAIELFLDTDLSTATSGREGPQPLRDEDLQLFLLPLAGRWLRRPWSIDKPLQPQPPTGSELTGMQLASQRLSADTYSFEARIPFHNFLQVRDGESIDSLGLHLAVDDRDPGSSVVHYMTLDGSNPTLDTRSYWRIQFGEPTPLGPFVGGGLRLGANLAGLLTWGIVGLLVLCSVLVFSRRAPRVPMPRSWLPVARWSGLVLLAVGWWLPDWLADSHTSDAEQRLRRAVSVLEAQLPRMEQGTLKSYVGSTRDRPLLDLLVGRPIERRRLLAHQFLAELAPAQFGGEPLPFPHEQFHVRPYWIPLPIDQPQRFTFRRPLRANSQLAVVLAQPAGIATDGMRLRVASRRVGRSEDDPPEELRVGPAFVSARSFGRAGREMVAVMAALPEPVEAMTVTALGDVPVELVGMTELPGSADESARERPLPLGQPVGEVESDLRGIYPEDAGIELRAGADQRVVSIPEGRRRSFDKLWLVYSATYPGEGLAHDVSEGDEVCRVEVVFSKGPKQVIRLEHQRSMFFGASSRNRTVPEGVPAVQVMHGGGGTDEQDKHIDVVYRLDLGAPPGGVIHELRFVKTGPYPIRFRSVTFGYERPMPLAEVNDSPLQVDRGKVSLRPQHLADLQGVELGIYRAGALAHSDLAPRDQRTRAVLPAVVEAERRHAPDQVHTHVRDRGDARVFGAYLPLPSDSNAVLGVWATDQTFGDRLRAYRIAGVVLCLLSLPFLLMLFNDALGYLGNLRLRLMTVVGVVSLAPLLLLFALLVRALEGGHAADQRRRMVDAVSTVSGQLAERQAELLASARSWVATLRQYERGFRGAAAKHDLDSVRRVFRDALANQLPPEWEGGFLRVEYAPPAGAPKWLQPITVEVGDARLGSSDTVLREEPGFYLTWGHPIIGVRCQDGPLSLAVARPVDARFLEGLSPGAAIVLCDARGGYQLAAGRAEGLPEGERLMDDRRSVPGRARETRQPVFRRHRAAGQEWIAGYEVVRDPQRVPRAILGVVERGTEAALVLSVGAVPVRTFFVVLAGLLLILSFALASVVINRITDPIERLEKGAEALRRGEFDVRVASREGGQIGRLTDTFNHMAQDLHGRIQDLNHLNRGIQELTSQLEMEPVLRSAIAFLSRHSAADRVRVLLVDPEKDSVEIHGDGASTSAAGPDIDALLSASGPCSMRLLRRRSEAVLPAMFPEHRSLVALPMIFAGRHRGAVLLVFEASVPAEVDLELLSTITAQTAAAIENARLYRHAVVDHDTGAFVPDYFARLVGHEVAAAQEQHTELSLLGCAVTRGDELSARLGVDGYGRYLERVVRQLREGLGREARVGRVGEHVFQVLLDGVGRAAAADLLQRVRQHLLAPDSGTGEAGLRLATVGFPEEGASAEFLFHALDTRLDPRRSDPPAEPVWISDGVVLDSPAMLDVVRVLQRVAPSDLPILLTGETGTGKEVLADLLHKWSKRSRGPLVKVHCAALPESLLQSELFGHEAGAFTGAQRQRIGKFEQASGGTIFLDEIGEISLDIQVKLLRVLQQHEVDRVGGVQPVPVDVRVVAATNRDVVQMIAAGTFREDLYYRLQGMVVTVPPLRDRKSEIPRLIEVFRAEAVAAGHTAVRGFSTDAMDELYRRDWPGNVRELRNTVFRALVLAGDGLLARSHLLGILPDSDAVRSAPPPVVVDAPSGERAVAIPRPSPSRLLEGRLLTLFELISVRGSVAAQDYVDACGVSARTGLRDLNELVARGLVERAGRRRGARYRLSGAAAHLANGGE
ncbi:MAG: sigma 54-interacting transcriptional regulator [Planctomycetes bacterium]|nr:sigma 54-interacting transcriptional regulator [Planctomycetota bacterium]